MADIRARVKGLTERVAGAVPGSIQRSASQLGGGVAGVAQSVAAPVASGLEKMGAAAMAERVKAGASAVAGFQKNQLPGMENLTGSRVLGYGGMAAGLLGADTSQLVLLHHEGDGSLKTYYQMRIKVRFVGLMGEEQVPSPRRIIHVYGLSNYGLLERLARDIAHTFGDPVQLRVASQIPIYNHLF